MKNKLKIAVIAAFISMFINLVFADGHSNCINSKWGADDELGAAIMSVMKGLSLQLN